jgi:ABC-2 type transport system permease protein
MIACGLVIHYSMLVLSISLAFWITSAQGIEGSYFTLSEFSRLPREAFHGLARIAFVWLLPVVVVSNTPARTLLQGFDLRLAAWLVAITAVWFSVTVFVFNRGLRRYSSASS